MPAFGGLPTRYGELNTNARRPAHTEALEYKQRKNRKTWSADEPVRKRKASAGQRALLNARAWRFALAEAPENENKSNDWSADAPECMPVLADTHCMPARGKKRKKWSVDVPECKHKANSEWVQAS